MSNKALFLDRDGVVNKDCHFVIRKADFAWMEGFFEVCRYFLERDYLIIIITNQSGVARNYFSESDLLELHKYMIAELRMRKIIITDVFYCISSDDNHPDRKPNAGMFYKAADKYRLDMSLSVSIGDKERDITAAKKAGVGINILLTESTEATAAEYTVKNLGEVVRLCM